MVTKFLKFIKEWGKLSPVVAEKVGKKSTWKENGIPEDFPAIVSKQLVLSALKKVFTDYIEAKLTCAQVEPCKFVSNHKFTYGR